MARRVILVLTVLMINSWLFSACQGNDARNPGTTGKGARVMTKTYYMGRFALNVPVEMKQAVQASKLRYSVVEDFKWPVGIDKDNARGVIWKKRMSELAQLKPPRKRKNVVISFKPLTGLGEWSRGVYYFGNYMDDEVANFEALIDFGETGLWVKCDSSVWNAANEIKIFKNATNIAASFRSNATTRVPHCSADCFYLRYGALDLPYLRQEKTYSSFEGHSLDLKLEVEMNETHKVEKLGVAERLAASIATRFAPGVDVDKIRSRSRTAAGLKGEELVMRMSASGEDTQIQFGWEYRGEVDSGERPEIQITMETSDGNLNEKLKVWDAILDSFKPTYASGR